jgi:mono/diheme cytochrome c family protein
VRSFEDDAAPAAAAPAGAAPAAAASLAAGNNDEVKANYTRLCRGCHGETGKGDTTLGKRNKARDYTDAAVKATLKDDAMFKVIKEGLEVDGKHVMSAAGDKLTDAQIKALVQYMKAF